MAFEHIHVRDDFGNTALMRAAIKLPESDSLDEVRYLCACGADLDAANDFGNTAMMLAVMSGNLQTANFLKDQGANPNIKNGDGMSTHDLLRQRTDIMQDVLKFLEDQLPLAA